MPLTEKVQMSDYAERVLIDWKFRINGKKLTGTWGFHKRDWSRGWRGDLIEEAKFDEFKRFVSENWEHFDRDDIGRLLASSRWSFTPRQPLEVR